MTKRLLAGVAAVLFVMSVGYTTARAAGEEKQYTGWITDSVCGAKGASEKHAQCAKSCAGRGEKYALYDEASKKVYILDPQDPAAEHAGHHVNVKGTLDGETLHVTSISMAAEKGGK